MANGKLPSVQRSPIAGGLTGACAYQWAVFLAENYLFDNDDPLLYDRFKSIAESLEPKPGKPEVASFHCRDLEEAIQNAVHKYRDSTERAGQETV